MKVLDLFCGAGGMSLGFKNAGFEIVAGVDQDKDSIDTYVKNIEAIGFQSTVKEFNDDEFAKLMDIDVVIGGPPCQGFSTLGKGDPNDERNYLYQDFLKVVAKVNPKIVVIENVSALAAPKNREKLMSMINELSYGLNYNVNASVINAKDYGVAQSRKRLFIVGIRRDSGNDTPYFDWDQLMPSVRHVCVDNVLPREDLGQSSPLKDIDIARVDWVGEGEQVRTKSDNNLFPPCLRLDVDWDNLPEKRLRQAKYRRLAGWKPSPTITTSSRELYHPMKNRLITDVEAALIQSFHSTHEFSGSLSSKFRQIGNAVPPKLAESLAKEIKRQWEEYENSNN